MTVKKLILRIVCVCCCIMIIFIVVIPACIAPDAKTDNKQKTRYWSMTGIRNTFEYALRETTYSNIFEYVNSIEGIQDIPHILSCETIRRIVKDSGVATKKLKFHRGGSFYEDGIFTDAWGQPIVVTLTTNHSGCAGVTMHSFGKNKRNENGEGDDILMMIEP